MSQQSDDRATVRERLGKLFDVPFNHHGGRWDALWQTGDLPFDRGGPNPALVDALRDREDLLGKPVSNGPDGVPRRKRALVPGCGRGYDVLLLANFGYEAYGLEVSQEAVKACEDFAAKNAVEYAKNASEYGCGPYKFLLGDFFEKYWQEQIESAHSGFDLIYDYTFLSALPPETRPNWSARMSSLLTGGTDSRLVCVEFPTYKDPSTGGPPFGLPPEIYVAHLTRPGEKIPYESGLPEKGSYDDKNASALERIGHWQPKRTHPIGEGTDWVSVWRHA